MTRVLSNKELSRMIWRENIKAQIRNDNKIQSECFVFDISKMRQDIKILFDEFLKEYPEINDKKTLEAFFNYDDYLHPNEDWVFDYVENWNKDKNKVYIFITGDKLSKWKSDRNNKWFCQREWKGFSTFFTSGLGFKKTITGAQNPYYKNENIFSLFSVFCFYLLRMAVC